MTERRVNETYGCDLTRRIQYERRSDEPPSIAAATALARFYDEDITAASTQLYDYVDPDALDDLFADTRTGRERAGGTVEFEIDDAVVTVRSECVEVAATE